MTNGHAENMMELKKGRMWTLPMRFLYGSTVTGEPIHYTFICPPVHKKQQQYEA